jgi:carotenoid 1,2-hydratase
MNLLSGINQDFHRAQKSPGAYEWWHFDAADEKTGTSFSLQFFAGNLLSPYYQDNLKTYWQKTKSPLTEAGSTEKLAPNPMDYCSVAFRIFHQDHLAGEALEEFSGKFLKASDRYGAVKLGPSRFNWDEGGDPASYVITVQSPLRGGKGYLRARLFFTPLSEEIPSLPAPEMPSTHTWVLAAPLCHVEGTLQWCDAAGDVVKEEGFVGKGYHDHHWGTVPLDRFVKAWHWGRALVGDKTLIYSVHTPFDENENPETVLFSFDRNKFESVSRTANIQLDSHRHNFFWLPYEKNLSFNNSLKIKHSDILGDGPVSLIFKDEVKRDNLKGSGMSHYLYTPRLSSQFFFPMLKAKTTVYVEPEEIQTPSLNQPGGDVFTDRSSL